jgi:hypothetical protein
MLHLRSAIVVAAKPPRAAAVHVSYRNSTFEADRC